MAQGQGEGAGRGQVIVGSHKRLSQGVCQVNGWDLLIVFFTAFYAFAIGRNIIFWAFLSAFYGFWIPLLMVLFMTKRQPSAVIFPQWFMDWAGPKYINRTIKRMEREF